MFYGFVAIGSFFAGYYLREILNYLKAIYTRLGKLQTPKDSNSTGVRDNFVEPMTRGEVMQMLEEEKIRELNQ